MIRRLEVATEMAKKDKVEFERKMQDKKLRAEIELKRLRILEADKAKKIRLGELMDKATTAMAVGKYVEAEAFAKRAMEIDPNELAASMLVYKAKMERRYKQDLENRNDKEEAVVQTVPGRRQGGRRRPGSPAQGHQVPQELQGLDPRPVGDERQAHTQERSQEPGDRGQAQGPDLAQPGQTAPERGHHVHPELHRSEYRARPQGPGRGGFDHGLAGQLGRQSGSAQDRAQVDASSPGADLQRRGRGDPDHQPANATTSQTFPKTYYVGDLVLAVGKESAEHVALGHEPQSNRAQPSSNPDAGFPNQGQSRAQ